MAYLLVRGVLDGVDDVLVAGAAAEVAGDALADLAARSASGCRCSRLTADMIMPGRAVAALQAVLLPEALLQRMQLAVLGASPSMVVTVGAVGLHGEDRARLRAAAVDEHRARAALARVAADVRAGQVELFAQEVHEQRARLDVRLAHLAVDGDRDLRHGSPFTRNEEAEWTVSSRLPAAPLSRPNSRGQQRGQAVLLQRLQATNHIASGNNRTWRLTVP